MATSAFTLTGYDFYHEPGRYRPGRFPAALYGLRKSLSELV